MTWHSFPDLGTFHAWHDAVCDAQQIPYPGRNAATQELALDCCWTTSWCTPYLVDGQVLINLDEGDPQAKGLDPAEAPDFGDPTAGRARDTTITTVDAAKSLPHVWPDDNGDTRAVLRTTSNEAINADTKAVLVGLEPHEVEQLAAWAEALEARR